MVSADIGRSGWGKRERERRGDQRMSLMTRPRSGIDEEKPEIQAGDRCGGMPIPQSRQVIIFG